MSDGGHSDVMQSVDEDSDDGGYEYIYDSDDNDEDDYSAQDEYMQIEEKGVEILTLADVKSKYERDLNRICDALRIPYETAVLAMRQFNWDAQRVMDTWCEDPERARRVVGVADTDGIAPPCPDTVKACPVCFSEYPEKDMLSAGCSHFVCKQCWKTYLEVNINEKQKVMRLTCPALGEDDKPCRVVAPRSLLVKVADRTILEKLADYDDAMLVESNSRVSWCSQPGCKAVAMVDRPAPRYPIPLDVVCKCGGTFCFTCKEEAHRPVDCETVKQWNIKNSAESENLTWIIANTKPCPKCQRPIEKNQGCMHMTCSQCRHEFCWLCRGAWSEHGDGTGGFYACNRYEQGLREGRFSAEEMRRRAARESLERYTHYYERYHAHDVSRKEAARLLAESVSDHLRRVSNTTQIAESQLKFIIEDRVLEEELDSYRLRAHRQVVECRRILKWTYAYGFYRFDTIPLEQDAAEEQEDDNDDDDGEVLRLTPEERAKAAEQLKEMKNRKEFFEFLQGDAETALERLSDTLEKDLTRYYSREEFWREKGMHRNADEEVGMIMKDFEVTEHDIVNKTMLAKKFFEKLVKQLETGLEDMRDQYASLA